MTHAPWDADDRPDLETVRVLANEAFGLPCNSLKPLGEGWDFINFLADGQWVMRFPKRAQCEEALLQEVRVLAHIGGLGLPAPVPHYEAVSPPLLGFSWHFALYRMIVGTPLLEVADGGVAHAVAPSLGEWLAALHRGSPIDPVKSVWLDPSGDVDELQAPRLPAQLMGAGKGLYSRQVKEVLAKFSKTPAPALPHVPHVLAHADLGAEHILVDPAARQLAGVIDWGDAHTTVRTSDFVGLYLATGRAGVSRAFEAYGERPQTDEWPWLHHRAILAGLESVDYRVRTGRMDLAERLAGQVAARLEETV